MVKALRFELEAPEDPSWRVFRLRGGLPVFLAVVSAPDKRSALTKAISQYNIIDVEQQKRLVVEPRS